MRILLVEDDKKTANLLKKGLAEEGFVVHHAETGPKAVAGAQAGYDLIVLDVMLPGLDGWGVLTALRQGRIETPVLFLTAKDAIDDRVKGLELGADDYLIKPFAFPELVARIRMISRRRAASPEQVNVGDLQLDFVTLQATRSGTPLDLTPKEFALLALLARRRGEPQTRQTIASTIWGLPDDPESNLVDVHVRRLRSKIDEPFAGKLIHTVRGVGYVLEARL
jgi:two-component system, OmpR family, copper resistance phosphate regulon response regulator CusR